MACRCRRLDSRSRRRKSPERGEDLDGDLLLPGLVELHTDHLETHYIPRPKVFWDPVAAVVSFDGQLATSGITTVLDSLRVWREEGIEEVDGQAELLARAIAQARGADLLRVEHFLHLRCEVPMPTVLAEATALIGLGEVRLASMMDHTPGQRQFRDSASCATIIAAKRALSPMLNWTSCSPSGSNTRPRTPRITIGLLSRSRAIMARGWRATMTQRLSTLRRRSPMVFL